MKQFIKILLRVCYQLAYHLTPYVISCHNLATPPRPKNDDIICKQSLNHEHETLGLSMCFPL